MTQNAALDTIASDVPQTVMGRARRLQVRQRGVAAAIALLFVACGVLAMRHEATVPHQRDGAGYQHTKALAEQHFGQHSDIHGQRNPDGDAGDCALLIALHQPLSAAVAAPAVLAVVPALRTDHRPDVARTTAVTAVYRLAPKTSPPANA